MVNALATLFLLFSDAVVIAPLILIGLLCFDRMTFKRVIGLIFFSILVNTALKLSFQVPLAPWLHKKGFAFPSGHMQLTTVLYGWIAYRTSSYWLKAAIALLLPGIGFSLIYFGYHTLYDVIAAFFTGAVLILFYHAMYLQWPRQFPLFLVAFSTLLIGYIYLRMGLLTPWIMMAYSGLLLSLLVEKVMHSRKLKVVHSKTP
ncbi:MAG: phosphatase PAP2 family protein [Tatlockia sp.]|jgi:undecaprenyl-diphosphatase